MLRRRTAGRNTLQAPRDPIDTAQHLPGAFVHTAPYYQGKRS
jgi:hypothetical protein